MRATLQRIFRYDKVAVFDPNLGIFRCGDECDLKSGKAFRMLRLLLYLFPVSCIRPNDNRPACFQAFPFPIINPDLPFLARCYIAKINPEVHKGLDGFPSLPVICNLPPRESRHGQAFRS